MCRGDSQATETLSKSQEIDPPCSRRGTTRSSWRSGPSGGEHLSRAVPFSVRRSLRFGSYDGHTEAELADTSIVRNAGEVLDLRALREGADQRVCRGTVSNHPIRAPRAYGTDRQCRTIRNLRTEQKSVSRCIDAPPIPDCASASCACTADKPRLCSRRKVWRRPPSSFRHGCSGRSAWVRTSDGGTCAVPIMTARSRPTSVSEYHRSRCWSPRAMQSERRASRGPGRTSGEDDRVALDVGDSLSGRCVDLGDGLLDVEARSSGRQGPGRERSLRGRGWVGKWGRGM